MLTWDDFNTDSGTESVPLLVSERSQSLILAAMQYLDSRSNWNEVSGADWNDIEKSVSEAYEEIMTQRLLSEQYRQRVIATSPMRFNRLDEGIGSVGFDISGNNFSGAYTGITWSPGISPLGTASPSLDGVNDYFNFYSTAFASAFNLDEFTITLWIKAFDATTWTNGIRRLFTIFRNTSNFVRVANVPSNTRLEIERTANNVAKTCFVDNVNTLDWFCYQLSCSIVGSTLLAAGEMKSFINGVQAGTIATGNVAGSGSGLAAGNTVLGSSNTAPTLPFLGSFSHLAIHDRGIDDDILALGVI